MSKKIQARSLFGGTIVAAGLMTSHAEAQCGIAVTDRAFSSFYQLGGSYYDYGFRGGVVEGNLLHVRFFNYDYGGGYINNDAIVTFDITTPQNIVQVGTWLSGRRIDDDFTVNGGVLMTNDPANSRRLLTHDFGNFSNAIQLGSIGFAGIVQEVQNSGSVVVVTTRSPSELHTVDVSDPSNPVILDTEPIGVGGQAPITSRVNNGLVAFAPLPGSAQSSNLVEIFDVSDASNIVQISSTSVSIPGSNSSPSHVEFVGTALAVYLRSGTAPRQFAVIDVINPSSPSALPNFIPPDNSSSVDVATFGGTMFFTSNATSPFSSRTYPITFANPSAPVAGSGIGITVGSSSGLVIANIVGSGILARSSERGLEVIDISGCANPPSIISSPTSIVIDEGGTPGQLAVVGTEALQYQWLLDGAVVSDGALYSGASTATLTINGFLEAAGIYTCRVFNADGSEFSDPAIVAVRPDPDKCEADLTGASDPNLSSYGVPDGDADGDDFFYYLDRFLEGCTP